MKNIIILILSFISVGCYYTDYKETIYNYEFSNPKRVQIIGYDGDIMEPFISRDGRYLFFNNLNSSEVNTNIYYAEYVNDSTFIFKGEIINANSDYLDAVPTMDTLNNFYFVSTRSYDSTLSTIYHGIFEEGTLSDVSLKKDISSNKGLIVNYDIEITWDGKTAYTVYSRFSPLGFPQTSDIIIFEKNNDGSFTYNDNSYEIMENINTDGFEYASCISKDECELFFTHWNKEDNPEIYVAKRENKNDIFGIPEKIAAIDGFVEAPALSPDEKKLYYHKKENDKFVLYYVERE